MNLRIPHEDEWMPAFPVTSIVMLAIFFGGYALYASRHTERPNPQRKANAVSLVSLITGGFK